MKLTIGMPSYNNLEEVWWTCQTIRLYQNALRDDMELLVVDNYGSDALENKLKGFGQGKPRYFRYTETQSPSHAKNKVFEKAKGDWVICIDSHIMFKPRSLFLFANWLEDENNYNSMDLYQGPLVYDNLTSYSDRFKDTWGSHMWGQWQGGFDESKWPFTPYEIQFHGCGLMACRKDAWLGFSKRFRGFGGEEGYIQEKFRQAGRKVWCHPALQWLHYFQTTGQQCTAPYTPLLSDRIHNYKVAFEELNLDVQPILEHFKLTKEQLEKY